VTDILITADDLADRMVSEPRLRVLDVRWRLERPDGRPAYVEGHIPGAVYVDLDAELAAHGQATDGRHPLPPVEKLQAAARRWGLNGDDTVVVYDDLGSMSAARAWWLLADAGVAGVRILDGGLQAWSRSGRPLETGAVVPPAGSVVLTAGRLGRASMDEAAALAADGVLIDVRAAERYRGEVEPIDPRAGHIPGALNLPASGNIADDGCFLSPDDIRARVLAAGIAPGAEVGLYCGSGVTAAHAFAALTIAGFAPRLYAGSWSQWSNHPDLPVAIGPAP
jgi:thiosulfate/3-mercaptopyruvate sulfurtransferase